MDIERIWESITGGVNGALKGFERSVTSLFGSANERDLKKIGPKVELINALESKFEGMSDEELAHQTVLFRKRLAEGETLDDIQIEAFAVCREGGKRALRMRHYDVQLIGGMILHGGNIAEMVTGEGKTLVATLPAYLNSLAGEGVHVITVNDYLARRDMEWMGPLFTSLGLTVGAIQSGMEPDARQDAYACDITYGTNNEFGFDYLRDNMRTAAPHDERFPKHMQQSQGKLAFAIVDEVDNILIDEARTPLIISGPAEDDITKYQKANKVATALKKDLHFEVSEKDHSVNLTEDGIRHAEHLAGVESFYTAGNMHWPHMLDNALKAHHLYAKDVSYVVNDGQVIIVDDFTGRLMEGRQWGDGLHQAVEAKEGVKIKEENQTLATITLQNFFKLYGKLCGMTGTALTESSEFWKIYKLNVIGVPTNRTMQRISHPDVIYRTEGEKYTAIADEIERLNKWTTIELSNDTWVVGDGVVESGEEVKIQLAEEKQEETILRTKIKSIQPPGRPILVGTVSIEKSEALSRLLTKRGIKHEVLNAKQHTRESEIVAQAGRLGAVTIATNMAGRGTDIVLGGNPDTWAWAILQDKYPTRLEVPQDEWDQLVEEISVRENMKSQGEHVKKIGGLHIIGTERHEARRIDLQLRGRCGRQGDPGASRFYLSLEDDLMRIFAGEWVKNMLTRIGMKDGEAIESKMVSNRIEGAQKKREEYNFEVRKNLLEYDEVMDEQRKRVYSYRQMILEGVNCRDLIMDMIREQIEHHLELFLAPNYGIDSFAAATGNAYGMSFDAHDYRNSNFNDAERTLKDNVDRAIEAEILDKIEECLPASEEESEWTWETLAHWSNVRWGTNYRERDLKEISSVELAETLIKKARTWASKVDVSEAERFLKSEYGKETVRLWLDEKFGIQFTEEEIQDISHDAYLAQAHARAVEAYDYREAEYPILAGLYHFRQVDGSGQNLGVQVEDLIAWAQTRFKADFDPVELKKLEGNEIHQRLIDASLQYNRQADIVAAEVSPRVEQLFADEQEGIPFSRAVSKEDADEFFTWLREASQSEVHPEDYTRYERDQTNRRATQTIEDRFRPEMRRMERSLLLQILDTGWKDHLQVMDHLRSSVGLRGYAQIDPKVEYKKEGMRIFDEMWQSVGNHVTDLIFKMEQLDERFVGSTWVEAEAVHRDASTASLPEEGRPSDQQDAINNSEASGARSEPIRNTENRIRRNDPCPCGSGKKYKNCCLKLR